MKYERKNKAKVMISVCFACLSVVLLFSCLPDPLEVKGIPKIKPQIVVSTQIVPDQSLVVLLTKTFGALDASEDSDPEEVLNQIAVNDATVVIYGPDDSYSLTPLGNGFYGGLFIPFQENEEYKLVVKSELLGEVTASTIVKPRVTFDEIKAELYFNGYDDTLAQVSYSIIDPVERNWYMLNVYKVELNNLQNNLLNPRSFLRLIKDDNFNGEPYSETFRAFPRDFETGDTLAVYLSNVSEEYYNFLKLRQDTRFSFVEFLSEPINYPSNVNGGKGFFNLYVPDIRWFVLE